MGMEDARRELITQGYQLQEKFVYLLMALATGAIAVAVHMTETSKLAWSHVPLAIAVVLWGASILAGTRVQAWRESGLHSNIAMLEAGEGILAELGEHRGNPAAQELAIEKLREICESQAKSAQQWTRLQLQLLFLGGLTFVVWHIWQMALR